MLLLYYQFCKFYILVVSYSLLFTRHVQDGSLIHTHPPPYLSFNCDFSSSFPLMCKDSGERGGSSGAGIFIGGFILGGMVAGTLGCVYAPQISKALAGADRKDLMRKLPKFIYDEEKALEKTRQVLADKIAQLNSAIDEVSAQLHPEDAPNGTAVASDEIQASI
ncbi:hypothetical protein H0E87_014441 [Populus deltoides]|uniref:Inner membrane localized protein n=1 Tax=Populus deltoides TaxID=3696 RepID=A0A8T2YDQ5_POPDE|nr:hypothetical protein H0E87_014441 [Populus deltoides]